MDILKYDQYEGTAELDMDRGVCRGKILFIDDLVTYEAASPKDLQAAFQEAVDDYVATCAEVGKVPQVPCKGQFNVRIPPDLHRAALVRSKKDDVSLNEVVVRAMHAYLNSSTDVNHHVRVTVDSDHQQLLTSVSVGQPQWETAYVQ